MMLNDKFLTEQTLQTLKQNLNKKAVQTCDATLLFLHTALLYFWGADYNDGSCVGRQS